MSLPLYLMYVWIIEDSCGNYHCWDKWIFQWFYYLQNEFSYAGTFILNQGSGILAAYDTLMMYWKWHVDGSLQDCDISWALAMEILQSCTKPSMSYGCFVGMQIGCVITSLWYIINRKYFIWTLKYFWKLSKDYISHILQHISAAYLYCLYMSAEDVPSSGPDLHCLFSCHLTDIWSHGWSKTTAENSEFFRNVLFMSRCEKCLYKRENGIDGKNIIGKLIYWLAISNILHAQLCAKDTNTIIWW